MRDSQKNPRDDPPAFVDEPLRVSMRCVELDINQINNVSRARAASSRISITSFSFTRRRLYLAFVSSVLSRCNVRCLAPRPNPCAPDVLRAYSHFPWRCTHVIRDRGKGSVVGSGPTASPALNVSIGPAQFPEAFHVYDLAE